MEEEYYSLEQLICAGIACYGSILLEEDVARLQMELEKFMPEMCMASDIVRYTEDYINYTPGFYSLNEHFNLDSVGIYEGQNITLEDYLKIVAGPKLVAFMQSEKYRRSNDEAFGGRWYRI